MYDITIILFHSKNLRLTNHLDFNSTTIFIPFHRVRTVKIALFLYSMSKQCFID